MAIDFRKNKELGYKILYRKFSTEEYTKFINELLSERRGFIPMKKDMPTILDIKKNSNKEKSDLWKKY